MARWKVIEEKFKNLNKDITFLDAITLLEHYGYDQDNKGKTVDLHAVFVEISQK